MFYTEVVEVNLWLLSDKPSYWCGQYHMGAVHTGIRSEEHTETDVQILRHTQRNITLHVLGAIEWCDRLRRVMDFLELVSFTTQCHQ